MLLVEVNLKAFLQFVFIQLPKKDKNLLGGSGSTTLLLQQIVWRHHACHPTIWTSKVAFMDLLSQDGLNTQSVPNF